MKKKQFFEVRKIKILGNFFLALYLKSRKNVKKQSHLIEENKGEIKI